MLIRPATSQDLPSWTALRAQLWPDTAPEVHHDEAASWLTTSPDQTIALVAISPETGICAFAEAGLRHDHVNGCDTSPVGFLEGIYVSPDKQKTGLGRRLVDAVEAWARARGCRELASDADLDNHDSIAFHGTTGFEETARVVCFRKQL